MSADLLFMFLFECGNIVDVCPQKSSHSRAAQRIWYLKSTKCAAVESRKKWKPRSRYSLQFIQIVWDAQFCSFWMDILDDLSSTHLRWYKLIAALLYAYHIMLTILSFVHFSLALWEIWKYAERMKTSAFEFEFEFVISVYSSSFSIQIYACTDTWFHSIAIVFSAVQQFSFAAFWKRNHQSKLCIYYIKAISSLCIPNDSLNYSTSRKLRFICLLGAICVRRTLFVSICAPLAFDQTSGISSIYVSSV